VKSISRQINAEVAAGSLCWRSRGAVDFLRAAHYSKGGLPIVALPPPPANHQPHRRHLNR